MSAKSGEPVHAGSTATHSAWFALTPTVSGTYRIDTTGSDFDTVLAIYTGNSLSNLTSLANNNNAPNATSSQIYLDLKKDVTYYIVVDGYAGAAGSAQLNLTVIPDTAGSNDIPFLPPWALVLLGSALFGLKGRLDSKAVKTMAFSGLLLSPLVVNYSDTAHADPSPQPISTVSRWHYIHGDHLDTPQRITDANQAVVWEARYTPFGQATVVVQQVENNLRFPGQYYDVETGLHYNYFRDYDPAVGRYVQSDPIGLRGGISNYGYALANPVKLYDKFGLSAEDVIRINDAFNKKINDMTTSGHRTNPLWNNVPRNLSGYLFDDWSYKLGKNYLQCFEQSQVMSDYLEQLQKDSSWDDFWVFQTMWETDDFGNQLHDAHFWLNGVSSNPSDPILTIDPFNGYIK